MASKRAVAFSLNAVLVNKLKRREDMKTCIHVGIISCKTLRASRG